MREEPLPWDFDALVVERARGSPDLLDLGTGGGEWLAGLAYRPPRTVATEAWAANVPVARAHLAPLGVEVVAVEAAPDNVDQADDERRGRLPFPDGDFHLVTSRHESYLAREVARVLVLGGRFLTQQVGSRSDDLAALLGVRVERPLFRLSLAVEQLERAGLAVVASDEADQTVSFSDVGALAWYLKAIPWTVPGFTIAGYRERLAELHDAGTPLAFRLYGFWLEAER